MRPLPKRLRNRRNKANIKGLQRCRSMAKHQRHLLLCTLALHARFACPLRPPVTYAPARFPWREVNWLVRCALSGEASCGSAPHAEHA